MTAKERLSIAAASGNEGMLELGKELAQRALQHGYTDPSEISIFSEGWFSAADNKKIEEDYVNNIFMNFEFIRAEHDPIILKIEMACQIRHYPFIRSAIKMDTNIIYN